ncbi:MAG: hypothetical protein WB791_08410 [Waddliaceae bacterium]
MYKMTKFTLNGNDSWILITLFILFLILFNIPLKGGNPEYHPVVLITGCGRSGTTYIANVFKKAGYDVDHERETGSFGTSSWLALFEEDRIRNYQIILHQIRSPLPTIASMHTANHAVVWKFVCTRLPQINKKDSLLTKCAKYWLLWNKHAESVAHLSYPIENISLYLDEINIITGAKIEKQFLRAVSTRTNHRPHLTLTWENLKDGLDANLYEAIIEYAEKWGYETPKT